MAELPTFMPRTHNVRVVPIRIKTRPIKLRWGMYGFVFGFSLAVLAR